MPDFDIYGGYEPGGEFGFTEDTPATWEDLFGGEGWDFEGEYGEQDMYDYLEDNPWLQFGFGGEEEALEAGWGQEGFNVLAGEGDEMIPPLYWLYGDVDEDDPYANMADYINELTGGEYGYADILDQMDPFSGDPTDVYSMYMEDYFEFDPETGQFLSEYDPQKYEQEEVQKFQLGQQKLTSDLETSLSKFRQQTGHSLGDSDLDISEIAAMTETEREGLSMEYQSGVAESEFAYLEDLYDEFGALSQDIGWSYD